MLFFNRQNSNINCDYIIFDLETSSINTKTCEILEIAAIKILNDEIVDTFSSLICPMGFLDREALEINKISIEELNNAPPDYVVMPKFFEFIGGYDLKGYNIKSFDIPILNRYASKFNFTMKNSIEDILYLANRKLPFLQNRKLTTISAYFKIDTTKSHRALSDCEITLDAYLKLLTLSDIKMENRKKTFNTKNNSSTLQLNELKALVHGIIADSVLEQEEIFFLQTWLNNHSNLKGNYPYDRIYSLLEKVLEDGIIEQRELNELLQLFQDFIDGKIASCTTKKIDISDKVFVLTGEFSIGDKKSIIERLEKKGAINKNGVSQKVDYLIVGSIGSPDWSSGNYGNKIKKAKELQTKGHPIIIISEIDFFSVLS